MDLIPQQAFEVELERGDLLVLPPFWWHHVETLTDGAVSVNAWTEAPAFQKLHEVYALPIPLESFWEFDMLV
jgi:ribosomal protein L16 Arg81 hydroxylase